jgi:hypothetical protein
LRHSLNKAAWRWPVFRTAFRRLLKRGSIEPRSKPAGLLFEPNYKAQRRKAAKDGDFMFLYNDF